MTEANSAAGLQSRLREIISNRFGTRLRSLRRERHLTQVQLADHLGIDRSFISDVERGKKSMSLSYLETVADGFAMPLHQLFEGL